MAGGLPNIQQSLEKASPGTVKGREPACTCNLQRESHQFSLGTIRNGWEKQAVKDALQKACIVQQRPYQSLAECGRASLSSISRSADAHIKHDSQDLADKAVHQLRSLIHERTM